MAIRKKTIARFDEWKVDVNVPAMLVSRVAEGEQLRDICAAVGQPYSLVARWIAETQLLKEQYDAALKIYADSLALETPAISDGAPRQATDPEGKPLFDEAGKPVLVEPDVARDKLRVDTRLKLAGKLDRQRYGEQVAPALSVQVNFGDIAKEIQALEERLGMRRPLVLEQEPAAIAGAVPAAADAEAI